MALESFSAQKEFGEPPRKIAKETTVEQNGFVYTVTVYEKSEEKIEDAAAEVIPRPRRVNKSPKPRKHL